MSVPKINLNGARAWWKDDKIHRDGGPAFEWPDGTHYWYKDGKHHRNDGPAVEYSDGNRMWYENGEFVKHECS
jgi:hypothetical protein